MVVNSADTAQRLRTNVLFGPAMRISMKEMLNFVGMIETHQNTSNRKKNCSISISTTGKWSS